MKTATHFCCLVALAAASTLTLAQSPVSATDESDTQTVVLTKVKTPWYAPRAVMVSKFRDSIPQYEAVPGLTYKYYTLSEDGKFGGLYLWNTRNQAKAWFDEAWHARVLRERGVAGEVTFFDAPVTLDNSRPGDDAVGGDGKAVASIVRIPIPAGISREFIVAEFRKSLPQYQAIPGLARKYFIITEDGRFGGVYLWKSREAAQAFYNDAWHQRVRKTYGADADIAWFDVPVLLPSKLKSASHAGN